VSHSKAAQHQPKKQKAKWHQEIDDEWTSHPNFPTGPYNQGVHEEAQVSQPTKHAAKKPIAAKKHAKKVHQKKKPTAQFVKENHVHFAQKQNNCTSIECHEDTVDPYSAEYEHPAQDNVPYMGLDADVIRPTNENAANNYAGAQAHRATTIAAQMEKSAVRSKKSDPNFTTDPTVASSNDGNYQVLHYPGEGTLDANG
jgi:hypothetical protein